MVYFFYAGNQEFRIWLDDSPGDVFDVVSPANLVPKLEEYVAKGYKLVAGEPED